MGKQSDDKPESLPASQFLLKSMHTKFDKETRDKNMHIAFGLFSVEVAWRRRKLKQNIVVIIVFWDSHYEPGLTKTSYHTISIYEKTSCHTVP